jgi:hypothetical protein
MRNLGTVGVHTSSSFRRWCDILRFVERRQAVVCDLENPPCINDAVPGSEITMDSDGTGVQILHSLWTATKLHSTMGNYILASYT